MSVGLQGIALHDELTSCRAWSSAAWLIDVHLVPIRSGDFLFTRSFRIFNSRLAVILNRTYQQIASFCREVFKDLLGRRSLVVVIFDLECPTKVSR